MPFTRCTVDEGDLVGRRVEPRSVEHGAQPRLEPGRVGSERRDRDQRVEIVAVTRLGPATAAVEGLERAAEPDLVADRAAAASRCRHRRASSAPSSVEVVDELVESAGAPLRRDSRNARERQCRRPAIRCSTSRRSDRLGRRAAVARSGPPQRVRRDRRREPEVRERGARAGALEHLDADRRVRRGCPPPRTAAATPSSTARTRRQHRDRRPGARRRRATPAPGRPRRARELLGGSALGR